MAAIEKTEVSVPFETDRVIFRKYQGELAGRLYSWELASNGFASGCVFSCGQINQTFQEYQTNVLRRLAANPEFYGVV